LQRHHGTKDILTGTIPGKIKMIKKPGRQHWIPHPKFPGVGEYIGDFSDIANKYFRIISKSVGDPIGFKGSRFPGFE